MVKPIPNNKIFSELQYSKSKAVSDNLHGKVVYRKRSSIRDKVNLRTMIDAENNYVLRSFNKKVSKNNSEYR